MVRFWHLVVFLSLHFFCHNAQFYFVFALNISLHLCLVLIKEKVCDCFLNVQMDHDEQLVHTLQSPDGICSRCGGSALNCLTLKIADLGLSKKLQVTCCRFVNDSNAALFDFSSFEQYSVLNSSAFCGKHNDIYRNKIDAKSPSVFQE